PVPEAHGTSIAGILVARNQMKGIAPEARVVSVRAFSSAGAGRSPEATTLSVIKGLEWAFIGGTRLYNLSFTGPRDPLLEQLLERAEAQGAVFVAAAGNAGPGAPAAYPAAYKTVVAVTAVDANDRVYARASRGPYVAIAAPGVDILAPTLASGYGMSSGTSMAAAHVTGAIALVMEKRPDLKPAQIREVLLRAVRPGDAASARDIGAGILDAAKLIEVVAR
ncbi:MAG TPA: S8 family serine peptidase, partial [Hyphomicrobiaceae bacterium]|nr:S8 family serine peptidase [Hyphomicrobiaceae bacterium]